ncbi:hypothetical protein EKO27_g9366 [Xylaria grammica]|uniref:Uncharacterized protein n=1 Tax=Xylaria grammica TaxID=363999 RepID=A0A439CUD1_9PEZI|nr:hypothetical protein EKO27_g9366 [Xylaria grammica]
MSSDNESNPSSATITHEYVDPSQLGLLREDAEIVKPTEKKPYYKLYMDNERPDSGHGYCLVLVSVTKPLPHPLIPAFEHSKPTDFVKIRHQPLCRCANFSKTAAGFFAAWQDIRQRLWDDGNDRAFSVFYSSDYNYDFQLSKALAYASLAARLALGKPIPPGYISLVKQYGTLEIKENLQATGVFADFLADPEEYFTYPYMSEGSDDSTRPKFIRRAGVDIPAVEDPGMEDPGDSGDGGGNAIDIPDESFDIPGPNMPVPDIPVPDAEPPRPPSALDEEGHFDLLRWHEQLADAGIVGMEIPGAGRLDPGLFYISIFDAEHANLECVNPARVTRSNAEVPAAAEAAVPASMGSSEEERIEPSNAEVPRAATAAVPVDIGSPADERVRSFAEIAAAAATAAAPVLVGVGSSEEERIEPPNAEAAGAATAAAPVDMGRPADERARYFAEIAAATTAAAAPVPVGVGGSEEERVDLVPSDPLPPDIPTRDAQDSD